MHDAEALVIRVNEEGEGKGAFSYISIVCPKVIPSLGMD
jgi:hypothetical protein